MSHAESQPALLSPGFRILEGLMTTLDVGGVLNVAPMGPMVDEAMATFILRPFVTSTTYQNFKATRQGVFHVTDDALLIARGAMGKLKHERQDPSQQSLPTQPATHVQGVVLTDACRYHELEVESIDDSQDRTVIKARCVHAQSLRDFLGFCRAKHAVIEAAILATRLHLTGTTAVLEEYDRLKVIVQKTGAADEHQAMKELTDYVLNARSQNKLSGQ